MRTKNELLSKARVLFTIDDCYYCNQYKQFVERLNINLPFDKRINVRTVTQYYDYNISDDFLFLAFKDFIKGSFPVLFFEGTRIDGSNTRIEAEAWLRARLHDDFIVKEENPYMFNKECRIIKKGWFRTKLQCQ